MLCFTVIRFSIALEYCISLETIFELTFSFLVCLDHKISGDFDLVPVFWTHAGMEKMSKT